MLIFNVTNLDTYSYEKALFFINKRLVIKIFITYIFCLEKVELDYRVYTIQLVVFLFGS